VVNGPAAESPQIVDLGGDGFSLLAAVSTCWASSPSRPSFIARGHTISLTTLRGPRAVSGAAFAGYTVRTWREGEFTYVAVATCRTSISTGSSARFWRAYRARAEQFRAAGNGKTDSLGIVRFLAGGGIRLPTDLGSRDRNQIHISGFTEIDDQIHNSATADLC